MNWYVSLMQQKPNEEEKEPSLKDTEEPIITAQEESFQKTSRSRLINSCWRTHKTLWWSANSRRMQRRDAELSNFPNDGNNKKTWKTAKIKSRVRKDEIESNSGVGGNDSKTRRAAAADSRTNARSLAWRTQSKEPPRLSVRRILELPDSALIQEVMMSHDVKKETAITVKRHEYGVNYTGLPVSWSNSCLLWTILNNNEKNKALLSVSLLFLCQCLNFTILKSHDFSL